MNVVDQSLPYLNVFLMSLRIGLRSLIWKLFGAIHCWSNSKQCLCSKVNISPPKGEWLSSCPKTRAHQTPPGRAAAALSNRLSPPSVWTPPLTLLLPEGHCACQDTLHQSQNLWVSARTFCCSSLSRTAYSYVLVLWYTVQKCTQMWVSFSNLTKSLCFLLTQGGHRVARPFH